MNTAKFDQLVKMAETVFNGLSLVMNKAIQFGSQMGTIIRAMKKATSNEEKDPTPAIETLPDEEKLIHELPEVDFTSEEKTE